MFYSSEFIPQLVPRYPPSLNLRAATVEKERRIRRGCRRERPYGISGRVAQRGKSAPFLIAPCGDPEEELEEEEEEDGYTERPGAHL